MNASYNNAADRLRDILLHILQIINFQDNKEDFINQFVQICFSKTILAYNHQLSTQQQDLLKKTQEELKDKSLEEQAGLLKKKLGFDDIKIQKLFLQVSKKTLKAYIATIMPALTESQKNELEHYLYSI